MKCVRAFAAILVAVALGCAGSDALGPALGANIDLAFTGLAALPPAQGSYEVWVFGGPDTLSAGRLPGHSGEITSFRFGNPMARAEGIMVTVERAGDLDDVPSGVVLLHGRFSAGRAELRIEGVVTDGRPLQDAPGAHSLFTTSNNVAEGYPSAENAGLWLFSVAPSRNVHGTREVKLTPLRRSWMYEGWIVRQGEPEIWISYGKFRPDELSLLRSRDDTGAGPFSGDEDFRNAGVEDVPGEEWTSDRIARQLGITLPDGVSLPLTLDAVDAGGRALWHHAITIEPAFDELEAPLEGVPFVIRPYENEIGAGGPGEPRVIRQVRTGPRATAKVAR